MIYPQVRRAVLLNREDVDSDTEWEEGDTEVGDISEVSLDKEDHSVNVVSYRLEVSELKWNPEQKA